MPKIALRRVVFLEAHELPNTYFWNNNYWNKPQLVLNYISHDGIAFHILTANYRNDSITQRNAHQEEIEINLHCRSLSVYSTLIISLTVRSIVSCFIFF